MIKLNLGGRDVPYDRARMSDGTIQVTIKEPGAWARRGVFDIHARIQSMDDVFELFVLTDAVRRIDYSHVIRLTMPFLPYARQDKVHAAGQSLALKMFCDILNSQRYESVTIWDVHSDVALPLIDRVYNIPQSTFVTRIALQGIGDKLILVAPDMGATKKTQATAKLTGLPMVQAEKVRDPRTGRILETKVYSENVGASSFLMVDDICDGGATFIELAKLLKPLTTGKVYLYVTHGIFARGLHPILRDIDRVFCANIFRSDKTDGVDPMVLTEVRL